MAILSRLWPWVLIVVCGGILASSVLGTVLAQIFPWTAGIAELAKTEDVSWRICLGGKNYHKVSSGGFYEETSTSWGISKDIPATLIHLNEKDRRYKQRSYILLATFFDRPGMWTVTQNQDGEFALDYSQSDLISSFCIYLLLLVLAGLGFFKIVQRRRQKFL